MPYINYLLQSLENCAKMVMEHPFNSSCLIAADGYRKMADEKILTAKHNEETPARSSDSIDTLFRCLCKDSKVFDGSIKEMV